MRYANKCGVMPIRKGNLEFPYQMNDGWVKSVDEEKDLGVLMSKDLKFSKHCLLAKNKANLKFIFINLFIIIQPAPGTAGSVHIMP